MQFTTSTLIATLTLMAGGIAASAANPIIGTTTGTEKSNPPLLTKTISVKAGSFGKICSPELVAGVSYEAKCLTGTLASVNVMAKSEVVKLLDTTISSILPSLDLTCAQKSLACAFDGSATCSNSNPSMKLLDLAPLCVVLSNEGKEAVDVEVKVQWLTIKTKTNLFKPAPGSESCIGPPPPLVSDIVNNLTSLKDNVPPPNGYAEAP
ncbi:MAG: hypothetical protein DHS80DRAFT_33656, partial [Piptocephalis tieghemiana]